MSVQSGLTFDDCLKGLRAIFAGWRGRSASLAATYDGSDVEIDKLMSLWHDIRRVKDSVEVIRLRVVAIGAAAFRTYAESQYGSSYDIVTEAQTFVSNLTAVQDAIVTAVGGIDAQGFIAGQYIRLANDAPYLKMVTSAEYAGVVTAAQASISFVAP